MATRYQETIDRIKKSMADNKKPDSEQKKNSAYQDTIDRIRAQMAGVGTSAPESDAEKRVQALFDKSNPDRSSESVQSNDTSTSKYQDTIDRIRTKISGGELHTVPSAEEYREQKAKESAPLKHFETQMDVLKHGMPASPGEQFKAWTEEQEEKKRKQVQWLPDYTASSLSENRFPANTTRAVMPGDTYDPNGLGATLMQIKNVHSDIEKLEKERDADEGSPEIQKMADELNELINRRSDLIIKSDMATETQDYGAEIQALDQKITRMRDALNTENEARKKSFADQITSLEDEIFSLYGSLFNRYDFNEKSKYVSTRKKDENGNFVEPEFNAFSKTYTSTGFDDILYDYINKNQEALERRGLNNASNQQGWNDTELQEMTDDEVKIFNYLYATAGKDSAYDFIDYITSDLNERQRQTISKEWKTYAEEDPVGSSVFSAIMSPAKVLTAVEQSLDYLDDGKIDQNAAYNRYSYVPSAIRETVSKDIEKDLGEFWGPVGSFGYNVGMSMADFVTTTAVSGGNAVVSQIIMGSGAAADTVISAKDRGLNDDQAFALGVVAGLAEAVTEKYSIDALFKAIKAGKGAVVKHILKNMVTEGSEEVASSAINGFADIIVSQDESEWNKAIQNYMSEDGGGYSEDAAFGLALWDQVKSLGLDFVGGAISGAVMGGGSAAIQSAANSVSSQSSIERQLNKAAKLEEKQNAALDKLVSADEGNKISAAAKFVNTVSKTTEKGINSVNASLDFIRNKEKKINNRIKEIDNAGTLSDPDQQEAVQKERAELQKQLDALKATDLMIRKNRAEIEEARKRKENAEYVDPGEFDLDADEDVSDTIEYVPDISTESAQGAETTETKEADTYSAYAENAVKEAVETAEVNVYKAAKGLLKAYGGDLRAAVDALRISGQSINKGNSRFTRNDAKTMYAIDNALRTSNAEFIGEAANNLRSSLSKYGITNVVVGGKDFVGYGNVGNKANYNRDTGVLTVSPYLDTKEVLAAAVTHELTHHGAKYDLSLVNDAVSLIDGARNAGVISSGDLLYDNYEKSYRGEAVSFMRSVKGQAAVKSYVDGGMSAAEAQAQVVKDYINEELAADFLGMLLSQDTESKSFRTFSGQNRNMIQRILDAITNFIRKLKGEKPDADVRQYERTAEMLRDILNKGVKAKPSVKDVNEAISKAYGNEETNYTSYGIGKKTETDAGEDVRKSKDVGESMIRPDMTETERYEALRERVIELRAETDSDLLTRFSDDLSAMERLSLSQKKKLLRKIGEQFGVLKNYQNTDIEIEFELSSGTFKNSIQKQSKNYLDFAKMLTCFDDIIDSAIGIEIHNRNGKYKTDDDLRNMYVLVSAFEDGNHVVPVKLEVKEFIDKNKKNALYVAITLEKIKKDEIVTTSSPDKNQNYGAPSSTISIADLFANVNNADGSFLKYIPNGFLDQSQIKAKEDYIAWESEKNRVNDIRHSKDVETPSERFQRQTKEQKAYLTRQLKSAGVEEWAKSIKPADRKKLADTIASDLPGVSSAYIDKKLGEIVAIAEAAKKKGETAEARAEAIKAKAQEIALEIVDDSFALDPAVAEAKKLFDQITKAQIKLNSSLTADGEKVFDSEEEFKEWKKALPSFIKFSDKGKNVSEVYAELSEKFPEFLAYDPDLTDQKVMVERMDDFMKGFSEIYQGIQNRYKSSFDDTKQGAVERLSERILIGIAEASNLTQKSISDISITLLRSEIRNLERENKKANRKIDSLYIKEERQNAKAQLASDTKKFKNLLKDIYKATTSPVRDNFVTDSVKKDIATALKVFEGEAYTSSKNPKLIDTTVLDDILSDLKDDDNGYVPMTQDKKGKEVGLDDGFLQTLTGSMESIEKMRKQIRDLSETWQKKLSEAENDRHKANINKKYGDQMTELQTEYVQNSNDFLKMLKHYIKENNDMFINGKKTDTKTFSDKVIHDLNTRHGSREYGGKNGFTATTAFVVRRALRKIGYESMNPTMFLELWGESGVELAATIREKETLQVTRSAEFVSFMQELLGNDYNIQAAQGIGNKRVMVEIEGKKVDVSKAQLMTLYALWQREQGRRHLENNGAVFLTALDDKAEYQSRTFKITEETVNTLMKKLSKDDIRIAEAVQEFLSTRCAEWGNEASVEMFGYSIFGEKHYFPIKVAEKVMIQGAKEYGAYAHYLNITTPGFAQKVNPDATGAIVIGDFFDVTAKHVQQMSCYSAYAPIANKIQHVLKNADVREAIRFNLGEEGMKYFYDFLNLLNGVRKDGKSTSETYKWRYLFENMGKRSAVAFSLSTAAKQGTSLIRALPEINIKYVAAAKKEFALGLSATKRLNKGYEATYDRMIANSGVARIKAMGFSDTGIRKTSMHEMYDKHYVRGGAGREIMISSAPTRAILKASDKFTEAGMWMAGKADEITWVTIYRACEIEAAQKNPGLSSEAQQKIAAKKFNHIIGMTQVVDSIMDSAPFQSNVLGTTFGVFLNEPIKTFGNLIVALDGVKNGKEGAKQKLAAVVGSIFLSNIILNPFISAIFSGFRDDEDDSDQPFRKLLSNWTGLDFTDTGDGTSWMSVMSSEMMRGFFGIVPAVGEIYEMILDTIEGYSSSSIGSQSIEDIVKSATNLLNYSSKKEEEKNIKTQLQMWFDFFKTISVPAGFPIKNILRETKAAVNLIYHASDNHKEKWKLNKIRYNIDNGSARSQKNFYDIIAHVIREGDEDAYQYIREDLSNVFTSERKGLTANDMLTYMESKNVEFDYTSRLWNIELQANFDLPQFVPNMQVEPMITDVYRKTNDSSVLPSPPSDNFKVKADAKFSDKLVWNSEKDEKEDSRTVTFKTQADLAEYTEKVGDYAYKTLLCFVNSDVYKQLSDNQKAYAIKQVYKYSQSKYKTELYPDYDPNNDDYAKYIKRNAPMSQVANLILKNARKQDK